MDKKSNQSASNARKPSNPWVGVIWPTRRTGTKKYTVESNATQPRQHARIQCMLSDNKSRCSVLLAFTIRAAQIWKSESSRRFAPRTGSTTPTGLTTMVCADVSRRRQRRSLLSTGTNCMSAAVDSERLVISGTAEDCQYCLTDARIEVKRG